MNKFDDIEKFNPPSFQKKTIVESLTEHLQKRILSGELLNSQQLRQESIAKEYNVSRIPVREALRKLEATGLIVFRKNKGAEVVRHSPQEIDELFELRADLESKLIVSAMKHPTDKAIALAEKALEATQQAKSKDFLDRWDDLQWTFHESLYRPANKPHTIAIVKRLNYLTARYVIMHLLLTDNSYDRAYESHKTLLEIYKTGNRETTKKMLQEHILGAKRDLLDNLENGNN